MNKNIREKALLLFEENVHQFCADQFHYTQLDLPGFIHYTFKKFGSYLLNNNSLYLNWEYSFATFEMLNEIVRGECLLNPISEVEWIQMFAALMACHSARTLGSNPNDRIEKAAIPHPKRGIQFVKIDSDNELWRHMIPRALTISEDITNEFHLINLNLIKNLILKSDPFQLSKYQGRIFEILRSSLLIPMISDPRLKNKFFLLYKDLKCGGILERLKITHPDQLKKSITEEFWDTTYLQVFHGLQALEKTTSGKVFLSYLYANVVPKKRMGSKPF